jgi:sodium-dependent dicarboxylate transporter 2/3/5
MVFAFPVSLLMLAFVWLFMTKVLFRDKEALEVDSSIIDGEYKALGKMSYEEKAVAIVFAMTALLWLFRKDIQFGDMSLPGWSNIAMIPKFIDDGTIAISMAALLFLVPSKSGKRSSGLLNAKSFSAVPWNIILLFGGGFAIAGGFKSTGLSEIIGGLFTGLDSFPPLLLVGALCISITFLTELTSNTATTQTILPILAAIAVSIGVHPLILMVPATMSASYAFMLPVATPPNAIVFGSRRIRIAEMIRAGVIINLAGVVVIAIAFYFWGAIIFDIDFSIMPDWAKP